MLIAAFAHLYAFPYKDYAEANIGGSKSGFWNSVFHALNFTDVVHDTMHQVCPAKSLFSLSSFQTQPIFRIDFFHWHPISQVQSRGSGLIKWVDDSG
jgi:hypothetical protein